MKTLTLLSATLFILTPSIAQAGKHYLTGGGLLFKPEDLSYSDPAVGTLNLEMDFGSGFLIGYGYAFDSGISAELEFFDGETTGTLTGLPASLGLTELGLDFGSTALFANVSYRVKTKGSFTPYFGVGGGSAKIKVSAFGISDTTTEESFRGFAGLKISITDNLDLNFSYRYDKFSDFDMQSIRLGLTSYFGQKAEKEAPQEESGNK